MAYINQETKRKLAPGIKAILKKYGLKGSLKIRNHSTLVLTIKSGELDFISNCVDKLSHPSVILTPFAKNSIHAIEKEQHIRVNVYHIDTNFSGVCAAALSELRAAMCVDNWDRSEPQYDHFDVGWYVNITVGTWIQPYEYTGKVAISA